MASTLSASTLQPVFTKSPVLQDERISLTSPSFPKAKRDKEATEKALSLSVDSDTSSCPPSLKAAMRFKPREMATKELHHMYNRIAAVKQNLIHPLVSAFRSPSDNLSVSLRYLLDPTKKILGSGTYGIVVQIEDGLTKQLVAAKIMNQGSINELLQELVKVARAQGPHVIKLINFFTTPLGAVLIYEPLERDLHEALKARRAQGLHYSMKDLKLFVKLALQCLGNLHQKGILHRDFKVNNMAFSATKGTFTLFDFGKSVHLEKENGRDWAMDLSHLAPEVALGVEQSFPQDIFALGCSLFYLFTERFPFDDRSEAPLQDRLGRTLEGNDARNVRHLTAVQELLGEIPQELIRSSPVRSRFFEKESGSQRYQFIFPLEPTTLMSILNITNLDRNIPLQELKGFCSLLQGLLHPDPKQRLTVERALRHPFLLESISDLSSLPEDIQSRMIAPDSIPRSIPNRFVAHSSFERSAYLFRMLSKALTAWPSLFMDRMERAEEKAEKDEKKTVSIVASVQSRVVAHKSPSASQQHLSLQETEEPESPADKAQEQLPTKPPIKLGPLKRVKKPVYVNPNAWKPSSLVAEIPTYKPPKPSSSAHTLPVIKPNVVKSKPPQTLPWVPVVPKKQTPSSPWKS